MSLTLRHRLRRLGMALLLATPIVILQPMGGALGGSNVWTWFSAVPGANYVVSTITDSSWIYMVAANPERLLRSNDGGQTWSPATVPPYTLFNGPMVLPNHPERLVAATFDSSGLFTPNYLSLDAGATWQPMNISSHVLGFSHVDPNEMYVTEGSAFKVSTDSGQSWQTVGTIPEECICTSTTYDCMGYQSDQIESAPSAPSVLMMRMYAGNNDNHKLCRSIDRGVNWAYVPAPFAQVNSFSFDPKNSNTIYAAAPGGGWKTTDGGATWRPMANGLTEPVSFLIDPENTQVVFARNGQTVWESIDGGATWQKLDAGIPGLEVISLALVRRQGLHLYAQVWPAGLWELDRTTVLPYSASINNGALFTASPNVTLNLSAPAGTTQMQISNDGGFAGAAWEPYASQKGWTITSIGETPMPRTVYVRFLTNGQTTGLYIDDIVLDRTHPQGSISIDDPSAAPLTLAVDRVASVAYTLLLPALLQRDIAGMEVATLNLTATDDISGVGTVKIGMQADLADAKTVAFDTALEWYLPQHGAVTIYVSFLDRAGNASDVYSATTTRP